MYNKILKLVLGLPKSIWINFRCMPLRHAIKLPVLVSPNTKFKSLKGRIIVDGIVKTGMMKIGFSGAGTSLHLPTVIENNGTIRLHGPVGFGGGVQLNCSAIGELNIGANVSFTGESHIVTRKYIEFGNDCTISWNTQIMDSDSHPVYKDGIKNEKIISAIEWLSKYTFPVYLLHWYVMGALVYIFKINAYSLIYRVCAPFLIFMICIIITYFVRKIPLLKRVLP